MRSRRLSQKTPPPPPTPVDMTKWEIKRGRISEEAPGGLGPCVEWRLHHTFVYARGILGGGRFSSLELFLGAVDSIHPSRGWPGKGRLCMGISDVDGW